MLVFNQLIIQIGVYTKYNCLWLHRAVKNQNTKKIAEGKQCLLGTYMGKTLLHKLVVTFNLLHVGESRVIDTRALWGRGFGPDEFYRPYSGERAIYFKCFVHFTKYLNYKHFALFNFCLRSFSYESVQWKKQNYKAIKKFICFI